eukprot:747418-Alexandrium_andersonii.AAC.1
MRLPGSAWLPSLDASSSVAVGPPLPSSNSSWPSESMSMSTIVLCAVGPRKAAQGPGCAPGSRHGPTPRQCKNSCGVGGGGGG